MLDLLYRGILIGIGATIAMDIWALVLALLPGESWPNWAPIGRWFCHLSRGRLVHADIGTSEAFSFENAVGWIGHYVVGILYGVIFALALGAPWFAHPTFLPALIWGLITVAAGWFFLQPAIGIGWAASKLPNANKVRLLNVVAHVAFALGMWGTALLLR